MRIDRALPKWANLSLSDEDPKMPKMKTKSSVKGRFKRTGTGKILINAAYKRHILSSKSQKMKRQARGTRVMSVADQTIVRKFMPYDR
jgi:large subunit ribosomal protein L35